MLSWRTLQQSAYDPASDRARCPPRSEPIELLALRFGFLPAAFRRYDRVQRVSGIVWIRDVRRRHGDFRYYRVRCADGDEHTLIHDLAARKWYRQREWRLLPHR